MWIPLDNWQAASSFQEPVTPPTPEPNAAPLVCVSFNASWMPVVLASLMQLTQPAAWNASPSAVLTVLDQATALIEQFIVGVECVSALSFRFDSSCVLQYSLDGGTTWVDTPGWSTFSAACFTGPAGPPGATGPAGPTPSFRLQNCVLQYSLDGGATWTNVSNWATFTQSCITSPPPPNPTGATTAQAACNIAAYLTTQIIQASLSQQIAAFNASKTLIAAMQGLLALLAPLGPEDWALDAVVNAGAVLYQFITSATIANLEAGLGDAGLWHNILCAIYTTIQTDGAVTAANWEAVDTAIDAVAFTNADTATAITTYVENLGVSGFMALQQLGPLYESICTCAGWCYEFDFTASNGGWTLYNPGAGVYSPGNGWESVYNAGGHFMDLEITVTMPATATVDDVYAWVVDSTPAGGQPRQAAIQDVCGVHNVSQATFALVSGQLYHSAAGPGAGLCVVIVWRTPGNVTPAVLYKVQITGTGTNPWGASTCT